MLLHIACILRGGQWRFHTAGVRREFRRLWQHVAPKIGPDEKSPLSSTAIAKSNFRTSGDSLPGIEANRQVCPTSSEITFGKYYR